MFEARPRRAKAEQVEEPTGQTVDENAPVVQVVNLLLSQAVSERASDVHIEPMDDRVRIRNRVDGALHEVLSLPVGMGPALVSRIKVMANMNIVERRRPQDGQLEATVDGVAARRPRLHHLDGATARSACSESSTSAARCSS